MIIDYDPSAALAAERTAFIRRSEQVIRGRSEPVEIFLHSALD